MFADLGKGFEEFKGFKEFDLLRRRAEHHLQVQVFWGGREPAPPGRHPVRGYAAHRAGRGGGGGFDQFRH
jgi:heme-degrading monooxygenase HmoA